MIFSDWTKEKIFAWAVHLFTASGVVFAALALLAILDNQPQHCVLWLSVSLVIDGVDGTLARKFRVKNVLPQVDGSALDLIIDYLNYVFIPVLFMYYYTRFPAYMGLITLACILVSSLYCFANIEMKSKDYYFVGFPATWNVVALYFYVLQTGGWFNEGVSLLLCLLTFTKIKFLHPFRVRTLMPLNILMTGIWFSTSIALSQLRPQERTVAVIWVMWLFSSLYVFSVSLMRTYFHCWRRGKNQ